MTDPTLALALLIALAVAAQLLAHRVGIPQVVPLLAVGVLAGPEVLDLVDPDDLLGDLLTPFVTLAVGVVLFDGALALRHERLADGVWRPVVRLVTVGVLVSWGVITLAAHLLLDADWGVALLIGSVLTLSGPTVVGPVLEHARPKRRIGTVLEWEGIVIDPVGAILSVLVFQALLSGGGVFELAEFAETVAAGLVAGVAAAGLGILVLRGARVPVAQHGTVLLALVLLAVAGADTLREDAGLVAAIALGVVMARQQDLVPSGQEAEFAAFGRTLTGLLIGVLFVALSARVSLDAIVDLGAAAFGLLAVLVLVQRPLAVALSTAGTVLDNRERLFAAGLMPRGIVVAATASAFQLELADAGVADASLLVPTCFLVIAATVLLYGLGARPLARALGLRREETAEAITPPSPAPSGTT